MPSIPKKCYTHITFEERVRIEAFLHVGLSQRTIARYLNRSCSTVSREIKRNGGKKLYNKDFKKKIPKTTTGVTEKNTSWVLKLENMFLKGSMNHQNTLQGVLAEITQT